MFCSVKPHYDVTKVFRPLDSNLFMTLVTEKKVEPIPPPAPVYIAPIPIVEIPIYVAPVYVAPKVKKPMPPKKPRVAKVTPLASEISIINPPKLFTSAYQASQANYLRLSPGITYAGDTPLYAQYNSNELADRWSLYPAIQDVTLDNFSLNSVSSINASQGVFDILNTNTFICGGNATFQASTIVNQAIIFKDGAAIDTLQAIDGDLYFNTELLARAGDIQNIADWSLYAALSTVNMNNEDLLNANTVYAQQLNQSPGLASSHQILVNSSLILPAGHDWYVEAEQVHTSLLVAPQGDIDIIEVQSGMVTLDITSLSTITGNYILGTNYVSTALLNTSSIGNPHAVDAKVSVLNDINMNGNALIGLNTIAATTIDILNGTGQQTVLTSGPAGELQINGTNVAMEGLLGGVPNSILWVNDISAIGQAGGTNGQILSHDTSTIKWVDAGTGFVTAVNGSAGAVQLYGDGITVMADSMGSNTVFSAPTLGVYTDLTTTCWGRANSASISATSAGIAAGTAQTTALAAQASATAAGITAASALAEASMALAQSGITSVNGGTYAVTIAAGSGVTVNTTYSSGTTDPTVTISATGTAGVTTLNSLSGALNLVAGTDISVVSSGGNTLTINNTGGGGGGVTTLNTLAGALTIDAGVGVSVSTGTTSITLSQTGITSLNSGNLDATILAGTGIGISTSYLSGSNNPTLVITNTGGGGGSVAYVASYNIFVAPNGSDVTGNGSANNPYLTIARALTARALISNTIEVAIQLFSGTYAPASLSVVVPQNTYLIGIPTGEVNQPVNINAQVTLQAGTGQVTLYGLNLFPASSQCVLINTAGTYNINNCNFVNTTNYCLFQSLGTCYLTECRMTCYTGAGAFAGIGGSGTAANLIMRDCVLTSAGVSPIVQFTGNLTMRQCTLTNTNTTASVNPLVLFNPTAASTTCEISLSQLIYTSATTATNKMCIRVTPSATFNVALVNTVNNLLICEGATDGSPNFHCIQNTGAGTCTLFYGNLLAGATAHNIGSGITKTQYVTVP